MYACCSALMLFFFSGQKKYEDIVRVVKKKKKNNLFKTQLTKPHLIQSTNESPPLTHFPPTAALPPLNFVLAIPSATVAKSGSPA